MNVRPRPRSRSQASRRPLSAWIQPITANGGLAFMASLAMANLGNLGFHAIASHRMGPDSYGALGTLLAVMLAVSLPTAALQVATTKAAAGQVSRTLGYSALPLMRRVAMAAGCTATLIAALSPLIAGFVHLDSPLPIVWLAGFLVPTFVGTIARGVLLAEARFSAVATSVIAGTAAKVAIAGIVLDDSTSVATAMGLVLIAELLLTVLLLWSSRQRLSPKGVPLRIRVRDTWVSGVAYSGLWAMLALDLVYARHFLAPGEAGNYIAAATVARAVLFIPQSVALIAHAQILQATPAEVRRIMRSALGATIAISITAIAVLTAGSNLLISQVFGGEFAPDPALVGLLALTSGLLAVTNLFVHYRLALGLGTNSVWLGLGIIAVATTIFHQTPLQVAAGAALGAAGGLWATRPRPSTRWISLTDAAQWAGEPARVETSVILPVYNSGRAVLDQIEDVVTTLRATGSSFEIIAVDDGSSDGTELLLAGLDHRDVVVVTHESNRGKGAALKAGVEVAGGRRIVFLDADRDIEASQIAPYLDLLDLYKADAVIGSKRHPESVVEYPLIRRLYSWGYQLIVRALFRISVSDTQVGIKVFSRQTLRNAILHTHERGFAFDLELLTVAHKLGHHKIIEAPVRITHHFSSTVSWRSALEMLRSTMRIHQRATVVLNPVSPNHHEISLTEPEAPTGSHYGLVS